VLGSVPPTTFIPIAESCGFIVPLGLWVLERACERAAAWRSSGPAVRVAVNVSPVQFFHNDFVSRVREVLERTGLPPSSIAQGLAQARAKGLLHEDPARIAPSERGFNFLSDLQALFLKA